MPEPIRIFLSHKSVDHDRAVAIKHALEGAVGERLSVFVAGRDIKVGRAWRDQIRAELRRANLLLLLFSQPTLEWDWCLYEIGLYTDLMHDGEHRPIVCLTAAEPPAPLQHLQCIPRNDLDGLARLVDELVHPADPPIYWTVGGETPSLRTRGLDPEQRNAIAQVLAAGLQDAPRRYYPCHRLVVAAPDGGALLADGLIAPDAPVLDPDEGTLNSVFGVDRGSTKHSWTWGDLTGRVANGRRPASWELELGDRLRRALGSEMFDPITSTFYGARDGIYRPELYSIEHVDGHARRATIVLDSVMAPSDVGDDLFKLLRADIRFRSEIFDRFMGQIASLVDRFPGDMVWSRLTDAMELIYEEATAHELFSDETLDRVYGDQSAAIRDLGARWDGRLAALRRAIAERNVPDAEHALAAMSAINHDFTVITAELLAAQARRRRDAAATATGLRAVADTG